MAGTAFAGPDAVTSLSKPDKKQVKKIAKKQAKKQVGKQFPLEESQIGDGAVTAPKLAGGSVTGTKLADGAVDGPKLADRAVGTQEHSSAIPAARVTKASAESIGSDAAITLSFDTEAYDTQSMHSNSVNNPRLTAPEAGIYLLTAHVDWSSDPDGFRRLAFFVNGTGGAPVTEERVAASPTASTGMTTTAVTRLEAGDHVQVRALQTSGDTLTAGLAQFTMTWQAPGP
jgi:hypothetical protein